MNIRLIVIAAFIAVVVACKVDPRGEKMSTAPSVTIRIGEQGKDFGARYRGQFSLDPQPAGLDFYEFSWPSKSPSTITLDHSRHSLTINNVLTLSGYQNADYPREGLAHFDVSVALSKDGFISHDLARLKMFEMLNYIDRQGWQTIIPVGTPRLRGKDMFEYVRGTSKHTTLDISYLPSLGEWMRLESETAWAFHAEGIFLFVSFTRSPIYTDPNKPGVYLVNLHIQNAQEYFRDAVPSHDRDRWNEAFPVVVESLNPVRENAENVLRKRGVKIDETYLDPPTPKY